MLNTRNEAGAISGHMPVLDGLRGLAIIAVLLLHFLAPTSLAQMMAVTTHGPVEIAIARVAGYGGLGVDLFFILSGFLITGILFDTRSDPAYFRNFYMRRVLRIFPLYYGVLVVVFLVVPAFPTMHGSELYELREHQLWAWLYAVNVYVALHEGWVASYIQHFWSLAVEEQFYMVWPLVVWLLASRPERLMKTCLALCALSLLGRVAALLMGVGPIAANVLTPFQLEGLALGGFLALYFRQPDRLLEARGVVMILGCAGAATMLFQYLLRKVDYVGSHQELANAVLTLRLSAFRLLLAALLVHVVYAPPASFAGRLFSSKVMVFFGTYSYGLYVYHHFFSHYLAVHDTVSLLGNELGSRVLALLVQSALGLMASVIVAWLSYNYFEKFFLRMKRFWSPSRSKVTFACGGESRRGAQ